MPRASGRGPVVTKVVDPGMRLHRKIVGGGKSSTRLPLRLLSTADRTPRKGHLAHVERVREKTDRARSASAVGASAQTLRTSAASRRLAVSEEPLRGVLAGTAREPR